MSALPASDSPSTLAAAPAQVPVVLCVDDEPNILSSLRRLLRPHGYKVLTAESGAAGLALLEQEHADLVISDMRMPEMDGARFLEKVRERWPDTVRLLLTGYSDIQSILAAINRGEIFRYITKPWDDNDILLVIRHALERRALEQLAERQNAELKALNESLEAKVAARTRELQASRDDIVAANEKLKANFITTIKILSGMIEQRGGHLAGHSRRVADLARRMARQMGLEAKDAQEVFIAALLHDIGKIGFSDELLAAPVSSLSGDRLHAYRKHPVRAAQLLMPLDDLRNVAAVLRAQSERFDGQGFPDGLSGLSIPLGARILALASDYDNLQLGVLSQRPVKAEDARRLIYESAGRRYDPTVVDAFRVLMEGVQPETVSDLTLNSDQLKPGMVLARDLVTRDGLMLLSAEHVLDERIIQQVRDFENKNETRLAFRIWPPRKG